MHEVNVLWQETDLIKKELHLKKETLKKVQNQMLDLKRHFRSDVSEHRLKLEQLEKSKEQLNAEITEVKASLNNKLSGLDESWNRFQETVADPEKNMSKFFSSQYPVLMMPLRIETHFKKIDSAEINHLWVRIFPDDCSIDTFEEFLSDAEIANARDFWTDWAVAAGNETKKRGAWRTLVDSHGAGRAQYIYDHYQPLNKNEFFDVEEHDGNYVKLVIPVVQGDLEEEDNEENALLLYWEEVWRANGNVERLASAFNTFSEGRDAERVNYLLSHFVPRNIGDDFSFIADRDGAEVTVMCVVFSPDSDVDSQRDTWTQVPKVRIMPERFYLIGYRDNVEKLKVMGNKVPLVLECGPDPSAEEGDKIDYLDGELEITQGMKWMVDFNEAQNAGMAFDISDDDDYDHDVKKGYDRLIVVGIRLTADKTTGKELAENLFRNHYFGNSGFSLLPVGTATNNIQDKESGYTESEDSNDSFDLMFQSDDAANDESFEESDRKVFNKLIGFSENFLKHSKSKVTTDQQEAKAMNTALWPATLGYMLDTMLRPVLNDDQIENVRWFFTQYVSGRGPISSIRIDDQPYGILPVTVFSRISWFYEIFDGQLTHMKKNLNSFHNFLNQLYAVLLKIQDDWKGMSLSVPHVEPGENPHQKMMDILGHHGGSVEFHTRMAQSLNHLYNVFKLLYEEYATATTDMDMTRLYEASKNYLDAWAQSHSGWDLLGKLGYDQREIPEIYDKFFTGEALPVDCLIDDQPLSEEKKLRNYATITIPGNEPSEKQVNYIEWLMDAGKSLSKLRAREGFSDNKEPQALLYKMLHHAMELGYFSTALQLYQSHELLTTEEMLRCARREPDFIHISGLKNKDNSQPERKPAHSVFPSESRYYFLEQKVEAITGNREQTVSEFISESLHGQAIPGSYLNDQLDALTYLKDLPTARLERLLSEHIDCVSYRLDAWKEGLIHYHLNRLRDQQQEHEGDDYSGQGGLYLGAYGWLEKVRPENRTLTAITDFDDDDLQDAFHPDGNKPIYKDNTNQGYIQAPSLNHAVTAAVLRNAYLSHASEENAEIYGINLSSERVRNALGILEGIRQGQDISALLGYRFERHLRDQAFINGTFPHRHIYSLRRQFPLVADKMKSTTTEEDDYVNAPIQNIEANNVVDGAALVEFVEARIETNGESDYFDALELTNPSDKEREVIIDAINKIRDVNDAVADLALAEGIHQVVQGNYERAAGTFDTFSKGGCPDIPEVVQTPRTGVNVTHRMGIHINPAPEETFENSNSPRAMTEPGLNLFVKEVLPELDKIICHVSVKNPRLNIEVKNHPVSMQMLGVEPVDLLFLTGDESRRSMTGLDDLIVHYVLNHFTPQPGLDADISIKYYVPGLAAAGDEVSVFELVPLVKSLYSVLLRSRPLRASDVMLPNENITSEEDSGIGYDIQRLERASNYFDRILNKNGSGKSLTDLVSKIEENRNNDTWLNEDEVLNNFDGWISDLRQVLHALSLSGLPNTGYGFLAEWEKTQMSALSDKISEVLERWNNKITEFDVLINTYDTGLPEGEKLNILKKAWNLISTQLPQWSDSVTFYNEVLVQRTAFENYKVKVDKFLKQSYQGVGFALTQFQNQGIPNYESFDAIPIDVSDIRKACMIFAEDVYAKAKLLKADISGRLERYSVLRGQYNEESIPAAKVEIAQQMCAELMTEEMKIIPFFRMTPERSEEWANAVDSDRIGRLLAYQQQECKNPLPVDDWFHGVARVREKASHLEQVMFWAEAFNNISVDLTPAQFPCVEPCSWFAMEFGAVTESDSENLKKVFLENDHLLYTAWYHHPFSGHASYCGLLVDEWTETVPLEEETAGTAFHYDRPNSEPPQSMLLAVSPQTNSNWMWQDLVDVVNETLDEVKMRGVEPQQIDKTGYACFLPATIAAITARPVSISANYLSSNQYYMNHQTPIQ
jgi:hypothetical protein